MYVMNYKTYYNVKTLESYLYIITTHVTLYLDYLLGNSYLNNNYVVFFEYELMLSSVSCIISKYCLLLIFIGTTITFIPMQCVGFNVMPRRILDFPDTVNSWNYLSSLGSLTTLISFFLLITMFISSYCLEMIKLFHEFIFYDVTVSGKSQLM